MTPIEQIRDFVCIYLIIGCLYCLGTIRKYGDLLSTSRHNPLKRNQMVWVAGAITIVLWPLVLLSSWSGYNEL